MPQPNPVQEAVENARAWVEQLGPSWVARFDQMAADVREWAVSVDVDPRSYEFKAAWCVATTFVHELARQSDEEYGDEMHRLADILATVGLWQTPSD